MNGRGIRSGALAAASVVLIDVVFGERVEVDWQDIGAVQNPDTEEA